ncbi:MAG: helix-turn-helix transcriptional regulator [Candidatus Promineifilaceae bacterium]|jgi:Mn-dependent DtxR family transcriptional regulator
MTSWTFITNHGAVLALIGQQDQITAREIAKELGITERSVMRIIKDLESEGYIDRERNGRVNIYRVNTNIPLRRQGKRDIMIGDLLAVLNYNGDLEQA